MYVCMYVCTYMYASMYVRTCMHVCMYAGSPQPPMTVKTHTTSSSSKEIPSNSTILPLSSAAAPMQYVAKKPSWPLLNDVLCFQVLKVIRILCMYVCMYVCVNMYVHMYVCMYRISAEVCMYVCMYVA